MKFVDSTRARMKSDKLSNSKPLKVKKIRFVRVKMFINKTKYKIICYKAYKKDMKTAKIAINNQISKCNGIGYTRILVENPDKTINKLTKMGYDVTELRNYKGYPIIDIRW